MRKEKKFCGHVLSWDDPVTWCAKHSENERLKKIKEMEDKKRILERHASLCSPTLYLSFECELNDLKAYHHNKTSQENYDTKLKEAWAQSEHQKPLSFEEKLEQSRKQDALNKKYLESIEEQKKAQRLEKEKEKRLALEEQQRELHQSVFAVYLASTPMQQEDMILDAMVKYGFTREEVFKRYLVDIPFFSTTEKLKEHREWLDDLKINKKCEQEERSWEKRMHENEEDIF